MTLERPLTEAPTRHRTNLYVGLDVEGILVLPKADFAWLVYDRKLPTWTRALFPRGKCEDYDGKYDDGRYLLELNNQEGHSTGTWPCASLALAGMAGITDGDLINYAAKTTQEMPGAKEFLQYAMEKTGGNVYLVTSSYPAVALTIAYRHKIPSSHVITMGRQLDAQNQEYFDRERERLDKEQLELDFVCPTENREQWEARTKKINNQRNMLFRREMAERSPLGVFNAYSVPLGIFMSKYFDITEKMGYFYEKKDKSWKDAADYSEWLKEHDRLFEMPDALRDLRTELENCFFSPKSRGNMGSRNKTRALRQVHDDPDDWVYVGDGIVDGHSIGWVRYGIAYNMRDRHALPKAKVALASKDGRYLEPVIDQALGGKLDVVKLKMQLEPKAQVFTPHDIRTRLDDVRTAMGDARNELNKLYVEV